MLVLSRKKGQAIEMSNGVIVRVLKGHGNEIVLGFEAPKEIHIWREELRNHRENACAIQPVVE